MTPLANRIAQAALRFEESITMPPGITPDAFNEAFRNARNHPFAFNLKSAVYTTRGGMVTECRPDYMSESVYRNDCRAIRNRIAKVGKALGLESMSGDIQKIEAVHAWTAKTLVWDDSTDERYDLRTIIHGHGVCSGIAKSCAAVLNTYGVAAEVVSGRMLGSKPEEPGHAWVMAWVLGMPYHLDPKFSGEAHAMCLIDDRTMAKERTWSASAPPCVTMRDNYHYRRGMVATSIASLERKLLSCTGGRVEVLLTFKPGSGDLRSAVSTAERYGAALPEGRMYVYRNILVIEEEKI